MNEPKPVVVRHISVSEAVARVIADCQLPRPFRGAREAANSLDRKLAVEDEFDALYSL